MLRPICTIGRTRVFALVGPERKALAEVRAMLDALPCGALRPLRWPHYTVSYAAMFGSTMPGEVSLAHHGALVLFDAARFRASILRELPGVLRAGASRGLRAQPRALVIHAPR